MTIVSMKKRKKESVLVGDHNCHLVMATTKCTYRSHNSTVGELVQLYNCVLTYYSFGKLVDSGGLLYVFIFVYAEQNSVNFFI